MFRWVLVVVGLWAVYSSLSSWNKYEPVDEKKNEVSLDQAMDLVGEETKRFIVLRAQVDEHTRVYKSGLAAPVYASRPADDVQEIDLREPLAFTGLGKLLGCVVAATGDLAPPAMIIEHIREVTDPQDNSKTRSVVSQRILASVGGTGGNVFVLSEPLDSPDESKNLLWLRTTEFQGKVCLLSQLKQNLQGPENRFNDPAVELAGQGFDVPQGAVVILVGMTGGDTSSHYAPVAGSKNTLLVKVTDGQPPTINGQISGVLSPLRGQELAGLAGPLGWTGSSPASVIVPQTAAEINERVRSDAVMGAGFGFGCLTWGGFLIRRRYQINKKAQMDAKLCEMITDHAQELTKSSAA